MPIPKKPLPEPKRHAPEPRKPKPGNEGTQAEEWIPAEPSILKDTDSGDRARYYRAHEYLRWQITAPTYDTGDFRDHPIRLKSIHEFVKPKLSIPADATVIDLVTGTGQASQYILRQYKPKSVIGVDWASRMLGVAKGEKRWTMRSLPTSARYR